MEDECPPNVELDEKLEEGQNDNEDVCGGGMGDNIDVNAPDPVLTGVENNIRPLDNRFHPSLLASLSKCTSLTSAASIVDEFCNAVISEKDPDARKCTLGLVPTFAQFCREKGYKVLLKNRLCPLLISCMLDKQVSNGDRFDTERSILCYLFDCHLVSPSYFERNVWPALIDAFITRNEDGRDKLYDAIKVVHFMDQMVPWVGSDISERLFVPLLEELSSHSESCVRAVCIVSFKYLFPIVSTEVAESRLVPCFLKLCRDSDYLVRLVCPEEFVFVSCKVTPSTRKTYLTTAYIKLLNDENISVKIDAFSSLGKFISTFAEPSLSLGYTGKGQLVLRHEETSFEQKITLFGPFQMRHLPVPYVHESEETLNPTAKLFLLHEKELWSDDWEEEMTENEPDYYNQNNNSLNSCINNDSDDIDKYNSWQFWRDPIPLIDDKEAEENSEGKEITAKSLNSVKDMIHSFGHMNMNVRKLSLDFLLGFEDDQPLRLPKEKFSVTQDIPLPIPFPQSRQTTVPQELLNHFVSLPVVWQDNRNYAERMAINYVTYLPGVALTIGKENWDLLKPTYEALADYTQTSVRSAVACGIHQLAVILGEDVATQDLVPIFKEFIKDLDVVRIGALMHLADFLKLLGPAARNSFLPRLPDFLNPDDEWNWRFRQELAEQLLQCLGLFSPVDTCHHLGSVIMSLLDDKAACVRKAAVVLVTELVSHVSIEVNLLRSLLAKLAQQFAHSPRWNRRQTFVFLCSRLVNERVLSDDMFAQDVLPHLLDLSWDPVVNVRLSVAQVVTQHIMTHPYFADEFCPHHEVLTTVLKRLKTDNDRDVRYFATHLPLH